MRVACALLALSTFAAQAQQYPSRAIRVLVGFPPGGGTDIVARVIAQKLGEAWGQPVPVENRPGATGSIAAAAVAKAVPDGYTLLMGHVNSQAIGPALVDPPPYDPVRDFAMVAYIGYVPNVLVVNPAVTPVKSIQELIALAKSQPGKLTFASPGAGSTNHLAGEMFKHGAGIDIVHVPYKGSAPAITDLLGGQITMNFDAMSSITAYLRQGRMRPLAVTTPERDPQFSDIPTVRESGFKDFAVTNWYGFVAPAATPRDIVQRLNTEINRIVQIPEVKARLEDLGTRLKPMSTAEFTSFVSDEIDKYRRIAKEAKIKME